jgi:cytoskeletal protein CcmA (bactofilin family)
MEQKSDKPTDDAKPADGGVIDATETEAMSAEGGATPTSPGPPPTGGNNKKAKKSNPLKKIYDRVNIYFLIFLFMVVVAGFIAAISVLNGKKSETPSTAQTATLDQKTLDQISGTDTKVGDPKQTLTVESNAIFSGSVLVKAGLDIGGQVKIGGALAVGGLSVSGTSIFEQIQTKGLAVNGDESVEGQLTVQKNLAVTGNGQFNGTVSAQRLSVENFAINKDLQVNRHIDAGGGVPRISGGSATGGGGTVSVNGSDTAGTVTVNTGGGTTGGTLATVTFTQAFNSTPHIALSPVGFGAGALNWYISRSPTGFTISVINAPPTGTSFSFDWVAME